MAKTSLGKVGILPKGEYSSATQYLRLDIVSYNGSSYLCIKDCVGIDVTNKEYWLLIAQKGDKGDIGEKGDKGDAGKDFSIYKTYASISAMESDASNVPEGEFVLIASNVEDEDNAKLYVKGENSFVYLTDLSGATGIKGEKGEKGDKPVNGVDYNTPEEKEEFKNEVVSTATTEVKQNIETIKEEAIQEFNSNASTKTNEYNDNTTTKLSEYNTNANSKVEEYNSNATQKTNTFNENATTQTETFNNNATSKTNDFNSNASSKTDEFNTNYEEKLESINEASTSIEQERVISDGKYARALKTPVTDIESTQIYAENDVVDDLVVNGVELTQVVTENSPSLDNPSEVQVPNEQNIQIAKNNLFNIENINTLVNATVSNNIITTSALNSYNWFKFNTNIFLLKGIIYLSFDIKINSGSATNINKVAFNDSFSNISNFSVIGSASISNNVTRLKYKMNLEDNYTVQNLWFQIATSSEVILEVTNIMISYNDVDYEDYYDVNNIPIPLINSAIGQYADTIDRKNNVQNKVIQELTLTGSESDWGREDTSVGTRFFKPLLNSIISNTDSPYALCTHFKLSYSDGTYNVVGNLFAIYNAGSTNRIGFGSFTDMSTVEEWKAKLKELYQAGTPVKIYYVAEKPTTNPLPQEVQTALSNFKLYQDLNNVAIDGGSMSFIYNKSLSKTIEEMQDEIQSKDTLIQNLTTRVEALEQAQINSVT